MTTKTGLLLVLIVGMGIQASAQQFPWTVIVNGSLTTSSQIYFNPNASDPVLRSEFTDLPSFFGFGGEVMYRVPESHVAIGVSTDYSRARVQQPLSGSLLQDIPVDDGYKALTMELTGYFLIPFSGGNFGVFMGGGVGGYIGRRSYTIGNSEASLVSWHPGFGIHVLAGVSWRVLDRISIMGEMKFRDLQFSSTNQFPKSPVIYQGTQIRVSPTPFDSNIHTDGITFQVGLGFSF
jgi:hypothetical protein